MKNLIAYFYNIYPENIENNNGNYYFYYHDYLYYFVSYDKPPNDINFINSISLELINKKIPCHLVILNKDKKALTKYNERNYVLLKIICNPQVKMNISDILLFNSNTIFKSKKVSLLRTNWEELWSDKIDYYEYQVASLAKNKELILNSFSYYIGLAENAISYVNQIKDLYKTEIDKNICLAHRRIYFPNVAINYYNPINYVLDYEVRDVAEYIKTLFFNDIDPWDELELFIHQKKLSIFSINMFYARLLYPSYYFDLYEKVMSNDIEEKELMKVIEKVDEYEMFLKEVFESISKQYSLIPINWIIKKDLKV